MMKNEVNVQLSFSASEYGGNAFINEMAVKHDGEYNSQTRLWTFGNIDKAKNFIESLECLTLLVDNSMETRHGYAIYVEYTFKKPSILSGIPSAYIFNIARVDSYFLD